MSTPVKSSGAETGAPLRLGMILAACCLGQFLTVFDASVLNVALPAINEVLGFDENSLHWVINAFMIPACGFLLLAGRLNDLFGHRRVFLIGITIFTLASLIGGLAGNAFVLVGARGFQGVGAAILAPATLTVLTRTFTDPAGRAKAFGIWSGVAGCAGAVGVLAGGVITEFLGWRWVMLINVPIGIVLFYMVTASVVEYRAAGADTKIDIPGAISVTGGIVALVYAIAESEAYGWGSTRVVAALLIAVMLLGFFFIDQARLAEHPIMPLNIFKARSISASNLVMLAAAIAMTSTFYFYTLLLQQVLNYSPSHAGYAYLPLSLGIFVGAAGIGAVVPKFGARATTVVGLAVASVGLFWLSGAGVGSTFWGGLFGPGAVFGIGLGIVLTSVNMVGTTGVREDQVGLASGVLHTTQGLGSAAGLVALVAIAAARMGDSGTPDALASGYSLGFFGGAIILLIGILAALALPGGAGGGHWDGAETNEEPEAAAPVEKSEPVKAGV